MPLYVEIGERAHDLRTCAGSLWGVNRGSFCGSDRGGTRAAAMYSLIITAKMNGVDPQASLTDVLARIADYPANRLSELLPSNWRPISAGAPAKAA